MGSECLLSALQLRWTPTQHCDPSGWLQGLVHWIFWNTEAWWSGISPAEQAAMLQWMEADLAKANANRAAVPWIISSAHKAWWMDTTIEPPSGAGASAWKILTAGGVDLFLTGHIHQYARYLPIYPTAANGAGAIDKNCSKAYGNTTNPAATYTDPAYMVTIVSAAPGDQEVNGRAPAAVDVNDRSKHELGQDGLETSTNNYGGCCAVAGGATHLISLTLYRFFFNPPLPYVYPLLAI